MSRLPTESINNLEGYSHCKRTFEEKRRAEVGVPVKEPNRLWERKLPVGLAVMQGTVERLPGQTVRLSPQLYLLKGRTNLRASKAVAVARGPSR
jgi:hypothetical protein